MIATLRSMSPCVWLRSGDRFSVQLMNSARRLPNVHGGGLFSPGSVIAVPVPCFLRYESPGLTLTPGGGSEPGVDRFAFQGQHAEHALVHAEQRLAPPKSVRE
jgi:hypothetical protein